MYKTTVGEQLARKDISLLCGLHPKFEWICRKADDCILLTWCSVIRLLQEALSARVSVNARPSHRQSLFILSTKQWRFSFNSKICRAPYFERRKLTWSFISWIKPLSSHPIYPNSVLLFCVRLWEHMRYLKVVSANSAGRWICRQESFCHQLSSFYERR
jgi:hypothetical protein